MAGLLLPVPAGAETLIEAYKLALQNDPKFRAARAESLAAGTAIDQARAGFLPTVRFDLERTETRLRVVRSQNPIFGAGVTNFPTDNDTLTVTQPIFRKEYIERYAQAQAVIRQAQYTLLAAEQDLLLRTTAAYLVVLAAADSLALARAERDTVGKALDLAREKLRMGLGTIVNQHDAAARHAVTQAREIEAHNRLRDARQGLREITGRLIEKVQALREEFALEIPEPAVIDRWVESALDKNLALRARREAVEVARQEVERQRAGHWPSVNLLLSHNRRDAGSTLFGGGSEVETTDLTLRLSVPIFEGGLTSAVTREAAYRYQKSLEEMELERRAVERATRASYEATLSGAELVRALRQSVTSQESALGAKEEGYRAGLFTLLPVLDAQRDLYLARRDNAQTRYDYLFNRLKLKQAAGTLSEADLLSIGAALQ
jgi:outer membrane protein